MLLLCRGYPYLAAAPFHRKEASHATSVQTAVDAIYTGDDEKIM